MADNEARWDEYMARKHRNLEKQFEQISEKTVSNIFNGVSIYVNGMTNPDSTELRRLMKVHGGQFQTYYRRAKVTHIIASNLSVAKQQSLTNEIVVSPDWITDSIKSATLLDCDRYVICRAKKGATTTLTARDPAFVKEFFAKSRLHHISTLATQMKAHVTDFQSKNGMLNEGTPCMYIHVDLDCFFASVAMRDNPALRGKPVVVTYSTTGSDSSYADIASCNYEARKYGIRNGMLVGQAAKLCPALSCAPYNFDAYSETSQTFYDTVLNFCKSMLTSTVTAVSCDEALVSVFSQLPTEEIA